MSKPGKEIQNEEYFKEIHFFYEIINSLKSAEEIKKFLKDILTKAELRMLKRRWHIARLLKKGFSLRTVASKSKTSTQTVSKIKRIIEDGEGGLALALERAEKEISKEKKVLFKDEHLYSSKFVKSWFS